MRIAISGANGFVGSNLANHFHRGGGEVQALLRPTADPSLLDPEIAITRVDYGDPEALKQALRECGIVIHNAGRTTALSYVQMLTANVGLTRAMLKALDSATCRQFIYISSLAAARPSQDDKLLTEEEASAPLTWYGKSKAMAEGIIRQECPVPWTIIRPVSIYGEGDRDFLQFFKLLNSGINFRIGRRERKISMIHIQELCQFIQLCLLQEKALGQVFFAADGEVYSQAQVTSLICKLLGKGKVDLAIPEGLVKLVFSAGDVINRLRGKSSLFNRQKLKEILTDNWTCSIDKARALLGWEPHPDLETNLRKTLCWYREQGWL